MLYSYHPWNKWWNQKVWLITFACVMVAILGILIFAFLRINIHKTNMSTSEIKSFDEAFCITVPNRLSFRINPNSGDFLLDLSSTLHPIFIYCTGIQKEHSMDLASVVLEDKNRYLSDKTNIRENSEITFLEHTYSCYEYSFKYLDTQCNEDFYCNVVWFETPNFFYILNFETPSSSCEEYKGIFDEIKRSFVLL